MRFTALFICLFGISLLGKAQVTKGPDFQFEQYEHKFGEIPQHVPVTYSFQFKNMGSEPLIITSVKTTCGCTIADYSNKPVLPKSTGYVKVTFNAPTYGPFNKTISVSSNAVTPLVKLVISGIVLPPVSK